MRRYYITDRKQAGGEEQLLRYIRRAVLDGVDMIQLREKDLSAQALFDLTRRVVAIAAESTTRVLVNSRVDIALAAGADGVHLPAGGITPRRIKLVAPQNFLVGVSCHRREELLRAQEEDVDFAVFGPVFASPDKGLAMGLEGFREGLAGVRLPVFALGGVTKENAANCLSAGAVGVAAIRMFQIES